MDHKLLIRSVNFSSKQASNDRKAGLLSHIRRWKSRSLYFQVYRPSLLPRHKAQTLQSAPRRQMVLETHSQSGRLKLQEDESLPHRIRERVTDYSENIFWKLSSALKVVV